jgi:Fe-S cluster assembly protein SufD
MSAATETAPYLDAFRPGAEEPAWLASTRAAALARFGALGWPSRREEAWRFTDLRPLQRAPYLPASGDAPAVDDAPWRLGGLAFRLVFANGRFAPQLSDVANLPPGAWLASTAQTLVERPDLVETALEESDIAGRQPFASLNAAFFADGFVLALDPGVALDRPVEIIHLGQSTAPHSFQLRSAVLLGASSRARLSESFAGSGDYWTNEVVAVRLAPDAALAHVRLQDEAPGAIHFAMTRAALDRGARYDGFTLTLGARLSRHDVQVRLDGTDAFCRLDGAYLLRRDQEATMATFVDHAAPGGTTRELFKGVVDDRAHGIFIGKIAVRPDAQRTDAHQLNRNLLLSPRAAIDTKPELEILADDVKCSHGATVGDLDEEAMFYLRSRGMKLEDARRLLIEGFATEALDRIEDRDLRDHLAGHLRQWLDRP